MKRRKGPETLVHRPAEREKQAVRILQSSGGSRPAFRKSKILLHGAPDILVARGRRVYFVEVKGRRDRLTKAQEVWKKQIEKVGLGYAVLRVWRDRGGRWCYRFNPEEPPWR